LRLFIATTSRSVHFAVYHRSPGLIFACNPGPGGAILRDPEITAAWDPHDPRRDRDPSEPVDSPARDEPLDDPDESPLEQPPVQDPSEAPEDEPVRRDPDSKELPMQV
jgi:hypothetical protein